MNQPHSQDLAPEGALQGFPAVMQIVKAIPSDLQKTTHALTYVGLLGPNSHIEIDAQEGIPTVRETTGERRCSSHTLCG